jgi:WD40 repeat protein
VTRELLSLLVILGGVGCLIEMARKSEVVPPQGGKASLRGHESLVESIVIAPDQRTLVSCGWDKRVRFWNLGEGTSWGEQMESLPHSGHLFSIALSPDSRWLGVGGVDGLTLWKRDPVTGWEPTARRAGEPCRSLASAPDGRTLAVGTESGKIHLMDVEGGKIRRTLEGFSGEVRALGFSADGQWLAGLGFDGDFRIWNLASGPILKSLAHRPDTVQCFSFSPDHRWLVTAESIADNRYLIVRNLDTLEPRMQISGGRDGSNALAISPDSRLLAAAGKDNSIRIWSLDTGKLLETLHDGVGWVKTVVFASAGRRIAYAGRDGFIRFYDLASATYSGGTSAG